MTNAERLYILAVRALVPALPAARLFPGKLPAAIAGRARAPEEARAWAERGRRDERPLLWLHGASAGELSGTAPIVTRLRQTEPDLQLVVTCSSPSGLSTARGLSPDHHGYVPVDTPAACGSVLETLRPDALVYAKVDVWPGLSRAAQERGVPQGMVNATVRPGSSRLRWPSRTLLREAYGRLEAVGAVDERERDPLVALGVRPEAIRLTGDAALEQALARVRTARERGDRRLPLRRPRTLRLVAGSTWPADEERLIEAAAEIGSRLELVLVPHEPSRAAVDRLTALCAARLPGEPRIWSRLPRDTAGGDSEAPDAEAAGPIIVDVVGLLAELYLEADVAYVGGAFDATGLHSVVEPAAAAVPVLFGPLYDRWEAEELLRVGAALSLEDGTVASGIGALLEDAERRASMGRAARALVERAGDAASAGAALVTGLLETGLRKRLGEAA